MILKVSKVTKSFGDIKAVVEVSFNIEVGEFVFVTGPSGAGKTTLIRMILRELLPDSGEIEFQGVDVTKAPDKEIPLIRQKMGVVFQDFKVIPERTVRENIEVALAVTKVPESEWGARVGHVLKLVGIEKKGDLFSSQLSGGELQRAALARALVVNPEIIIADEPTGNLDWDTAEGIVDLFEEINKEGKTIIMATHHQGIIEKHKKRVIEMKEGKVVKDTGAKKSSKPQAKEGSQAKDKS